MASKVGGALLPVLFSVSAFEDGLECQSYYYLSVGLALSKIIVKRRPFALGECLLAGYLLRHRTLAHLPDE